MFIKEAQQAEFDDDWKYLSSKKNINKNCKFQHLSPFLEENEILRSNSRLAQAEYMDFN